MADESTDSIDRVVAELRDALAGIAPTNASDGGARAAAAPLDSQAIGSPTLIEPNRGGASAMAAVRAGIDDMARVAGIPVDVEVTTRPGALAPIRRIVKQPIRKAIRWYVSPVAAHARWFAEATLQTVEALAGEVRRLDAARLDLEAQLAAADERAQEARREAERGREALHERLVRLERAVRRRGATATPAQAAPVPAGPPQAGSSVEGVDYRSFADLMRGSEEDIAARQAQYLPVFEGFQDILDVGCGRGEFLTLLREHGIRARGVDRDHEMAERCRELGLDVVEDDAVTLLNALPEDALGGVFAAQVVEHMEPAALVAFLDAARRAVRPGGAIVLETINPASLSALRNYFADLTHVRPLVAETLAFLVESAGFRDVEVRLTSPLPEAARLSPVTDERLPEGAREVLARNVELLNALLFAPQDYAVVGRG